jgi:uncharacterized protein YgfB (UPF0149 family)
MSLETIITTLLIPLLLLILGIGIKFFMNKLEHLSTEIEKKVSESYVRELIQDKIDPIKEDVQESKEHMKEIREHMQAISNILMKKND